MTLTRIDITNCVKCPQFIKDPVLRGGVVSEKNGGGILYWNGGFSTVFQILANGKYWAFKVWHTPLERLETRYEKIKRKLVPLNLPYFVEFHYEAKGLYTGEQFMPTHRMKWVEGLNLSTYISNNINDSRCLLRLASKFRSMMKDMHANEIAHGDLQHGNIIVRKDGSLRVIDYDSLYVRDLLGMPDLINGQAGYQHPQRINNEFIAEYIDNFSEILIYLSTIVYAERPDLWTDGTEYLLFSKEDLDDPSCCTLFSELLNSKNTLIKYLMSWVQEILRYDHISKIPSLEEILNVNKILKNPAIIDITNKF